MTLSGFPPNFTEELNYELVVPKGVCIPTEGPLCDIGPSDAHEIMVTLIITSKPVLTEREFEDVYTFRGKIQVHV